MLRFVWKYICPSYLIFANTFKFFSFKNTSGHGGTYVLDKIQNQPQKPKKGLGLFKKFGKLKVLYYLKYTGAI